MKFLAYVALLCCFQSVYAISNKYVAKVAKIRGKATVLSLGEVTSRKLLVNDRVKEDTSIVTGKGSFVRLLFDDGSALNIGPRSKAVISRMDGKGNGLVSLLKGRVRSIVKENSRGEKKFYIQTRTAAMAVRGTEFEAIYNPDNKISSVLTYKGEVAVNKTDNLVIDKEEKVVERDGQRLRVIDRPQKPLSNEEMMDKIFAKKETVTVKGGQFSTTVQKLDVVSQPVKISPVQLNILYQNPDYLKKKAGRVKAANLDLKSAKLSIQSIEQDAPTEGVLDIENKKFAAKAGGYLDIETGLYVPPGANATFNPEKNIYEAKGRGAIDKVTGQYEAPKGMKLDAVNGFVIDETKLKASANKKAIKRQAEALNGSMGKDLIVQDKDKKIDASSYARLAAREVFAKNVVTFSLRSYSQSFEQTADTFTSDRTVDDISVSHMRLGLRYASGNKFQPYTFLGRKTIEASSSLPSSISQVGDEVWELGAGIYYSWSTRVNLMLGLMLDQQYFLEHQSSGTTFLRVSLPKATFAIEGSLARSKAWSIDYLTELFLINSRKTGSLRTGYGYGFRQELYFTYWLSRKYYGNLGFFTGSEQVSAEGSSQLFEADTKRSASGLQFKIGTVF